MKPKVYPMAWEVMREHDLAPTLCELVKNLVPRASRQHVLLVIWRRWELGEPLLRNVLSVEWG